MTVAAFGVAILCLFQALPEAVATYIKHQIKIVIVPPRSSFVEFICIANNFILHDEFILILGNCR